MRRGPYSTIVGAALILSLLGAFYYFGRALFYHGWWLPFIVMALLCCVLYCLRPECWADMQKLGDWLDTRRKMRR